MAFSHVAKKGPPAIPFFRSLRKSPAERVTFSQFAKVSCGARDVFATCESFLRSAWRFRNLRKFPAERVTFSQLAKVSCGAHGVFQPLESFPRSA